VTNATSAVRYFMSQESEKAAMWDKLQELQKTRGHIRLLEDELRGLAASWSEMGRVLSCSLSGVNFEVTPNEISAVNEHNNNTICTLLGKSLNFENLSRALTDLQDSRRRKAELENTLGPSGSS